MDGLLDFLNVDFLYDHFPSSWFENAHLHFGSELTDEMIAQSAQEASSFFNMNAPKEIHEGFTTGVLTKMAFTENDDILVFNRRQMLDMGITDKEGFDLVMTHEGAHRALQGLNTGFNSHQEELCCDYMAGVRAGLNGMAGGKLEASLAGTLESSTHPGGAVRVDAIEEGVTFAHDYMRTHNGVPPTFSDCLEHFNQTEVYASTIAQESGHINLRPEHAFAEMDSVTPGSQHEMENYTQDDVEHTDTNDSGLDEFIHGGRYGNATGDYLDDSHPIDGEHGEIKGIFINDKAAQLRYAQEAKENAEWHEKRSNDAAARGDLSAARDHAERAASYRKAQRDAIAASKKCTK